LKRDGVEDEESRRVEALLRVNAELAAEIRSLTQGRTEEPRPARTPAVRRVARAVAERDQAASDLAEADARIAHLERNNDELRKRHDELRDLVERQGRELERLRIGPIGLLRRVQSRLRRRRANRGAGA
jgi:chromosome segregation ATPase